MWSFRLRKWGDESAEGRWWKVEDQEQSLEEHHRKKYTRMRSFFNTNYHPVEKWDDRMMRLSGGERICTIFSAVLAQLQSVTDGGTARRSHKRAELLYIASLTTNFQNAIFYISAMRQTRKLCIFDFSFDFLTTSTVRGLPHKRNIEACTWCQNLA